MRARQKKQEVESFNLDLRALEANDLCCTLTTLKDQILKNQSLRRCECVVLLLPKACGTCLRTQKIK